MIISLNSGHSDKGCLLRPASRFTKSNTKIPNKLPIYTQIPNKFIFFFLVLDFNNLPRGFRKRIWTVHFPAQFRASAMGRPQTCPSRR